MRNFLAILCAWPIMLIAQNKPFINSISPTNVQVGETVSISGANLSNITEVSFGSVRVSGTNINLISDNLIEATVPAGATYGSILVRASNNLIGESSQQFFVNFSGEGSSSWKDEFLASISPKKDVYDVCLCDLNLDGKNDVLMTHNAGTDGGVQLTAFQNNSTFTTESFTDVNVGQNDENPFGFISAACADLDQDGTPEAIFTSDGNSTKQIFIYQNNGGANISLSPVLSLSLPNDANNEVRVTRRVQAADIDGDGKLDLIVGNEKDNTIHVFPNSGSPGSFSFGSPTEISVGNASTTGAFDVGDLDNDGKKDLVIIPAAQSNEVIYVLRNESIPGSFNFSLQEGINNTNRRRNIIIGDFNNDGLNDIATSTDLTTGGVGDESIEVYPNTSPTGSISFGTVVNLPIPSNLPWGLDAGDVNGDGKVDIAVAAIGGAGTSSAIYILENTSAGSSTSFGAATALTVNVNARNVQVGDLNGDSKPDIAYSHNITTDAEGDLGVRFNETCISPEISPESFSFCAGEDFTLTASNVVNGVYSWSVSSGTGTVVSQNGNEATFNITSVTDAQISLQITGQTGCTTPPTTTYDLNYEPGAVTSTPAISINDTNAGAVCGGDAVTLSTSTFDEYLWTLPDGSTSTSSTIDIASASSADAGEYQLSVRNAGACSSISSTIILSVSEPPSLGIINNNLDNFCSGTSVTLEIPDYSSDFNFQWYNNDSEIDGETNTTLQTSQSGDYRVDVINPTDNCVTQTATYTISSIAPPTSVASGPTEICVDNSASFTSGSTGEGTFALQYNWVIQDADANTITTANTESFDFTFTTAGTYQAILTTSYDPVEVYSGPNSTDICSDSNTITVVVSAPPTVTLNQSSLIEKCQEDVIEIGLSSPDGNSIASYNWTVTNVADNNVIATGSEQTIAVSTPIGVESVQVNVEVGTSIGCTVISNSVVVQNFQSNLDISSLDFTSVVDFDSALLEDATAIRLAVENATANISWEPAENFSDPTASSTIFFPQNPITEVTLTATDNNNCSFSTQVRIVLDNIRPKRTFSPNGDGINDCWEILNIGDLGTENQCEVFVFDSRGRNIITESTFEASNNCVWDGNFNSSPVPEGVYYYVLKCSTTEFTKSGSILLAR